MGASSRSRESGLQTLVLDRRETGVGCGEQLVEPLPDALAQLAGRLLGERDGGDGPDRRPGTHAGDEPLDEQARLAGARTGMHQERGRELRGGPCTRLVIGRLTHRLPAPASHRSATL